MSTVRTYNTSVASSIVILWQSHEIQHSTSMVFRNGQMIKEYIGENVLVVSHPGEKVWGKMILRSVSSVGHMI